MDEMNLLERSGGPVVRSRISRDLAALGLADGDIVMFHTRMSAIGYVAGGPQTIIGALHDVVGPQGTLMVTCGWNDAPPMTSSRGHRVGSPPCVRNIPLTTPTSARQTTTTAASPKHCAAGPEPFAAVIRMPVSRPWERQQPS